jgi:hypothetical protein
LIPSVSLQFYSPAEDRDVLPGEGAKGEMTIAWAIIVVAILYLLDKHHLMKKALIGAGIIVAVVAVGYVGFWSYQRLKERWEDYKFASSNECYSPSTGKVHPTNSSGPWCADDESIHQRGTPLLTTIPIPTGGDIFDQIAPIYEFCRAHPNTPYRAGSEDGVCTQDGQMPTNKK